MDKNSPLSAEIKLLAKEIEAGRDRKRAFADLARRTGVQGLRRLSAIINGGVASGSPILDALKSESNLLGMKRYQKDTARINRKSLETLLPVIMVCFPMFLVLVFFPAAIQIIEVLEVLGELI